jgi:Crinkler effector protein N-terminal domain
VALPDCLVAPRVSVASDPPPLLEINCLVLGQHRGRIFPVEIAATKTVGALKDAIWDKKQHTFQHVEADALVLWKVSLPDNQDLDTLGDLPEKESLSPVHGLSEVFPDKPETGYIHIVVKGPSIGAIESGAASNNILVAMVNSVYHIS